MSKVYLNEDQKVASLKAIAEVIDALQTIRDGITKNELIAINRHNCLYVAEGDMKRIFKLLGEDHEQTELDRIRELHKNAQLEISRLKSEMASGVSLESVAHKLSDLNKIVEQWWKSLGFLHADGYFVARYSEPCYNAKLSAILNYWVGSSDEDTPVTTANRKKKTLDELTEVCDIIESHTSQDRKFADTLKNRQFLNEQLISRFSNARITEFRSMNDGNGTYFIREIEVFIPIPSIK